MQFILVCDDKAYLTAGKYVMYGERLRAANAFLKGRGGGGG